VPTWWAGPGCQTSMIFSHYMRYGEKLARNRSGYPCKSETMPMVAENARCERHMLTKALSRHPFMPPRTRGLVIHSVVEGLKSATT